MAIETSCDETAVCLLEAHGGIENAEFRILGNALYSQASLHSAYGGVYPSLAKREHQANLAPLATEALAEAKMLSPRVADDLIYQVISDKIRDDSFRNTIQKFISDYAKPDIDLIAVTKGPGLEPALWTGINFAEALGSAWNIPVIGIDHMEGHIVSALLTPAHKTESYKLEAVSFPVLALLISGGHTELVVSKKLFAYEHIGRTKDDAVGEAFDKVARLLDFPYPGGPEIANAASRSRKRGEAHGITFPRPMAHDDTCDFSFSGLKTAVLYKLRDMEKIDEADKEHIAEAFEDAARDVIVIKTRRALETTAAAMLVVGGGVSANSEIRNALKKLIEDEFPTVTLAFPDQSLTGDNAVMIGAAGYLRSLQEEKNHDNLSALGNLKLAQ